MMGIQGTPARLFYDFCLEEHVPVDHVLRGIDRHLALDELRQSLKPFYSAMGRPSVDPELMIRMLIVGYCMGIRSERRLCEETHLNLAYRWFCRLGLDGSQITRRSRRTDTGAFARAMRCVGCSRAWCNVASQRAWSAPTDLRSTPA
jgi:transposase